jgi:hypothetical protein
MSKAPFKRGQLVTLRAIEDLWGQDAPERPGWTVRSCEPRSGGTFEVYATRRINSQEAESVRLDSDLFYAGGPLFGDPAWTQEHLGPETSPSTVKRIGG